MPDTHVNFAYSTVATAPSPATTGTSLVVAAATGALFPAVPFNATIWPTGLQPLSTNAEIVRVIARTTDTLTIMRAQESSTVRTVIVGDQIAATVTARTMTDVESASSPDLAVSLRISPRENVIPADSYAHVGTDYQIGGMYGPLLTATGPYNTNADRIEAIPVTLPSRMVFTGLRAFAWTGTPGFGLSGNMKAAVYADSGGAPAALLYSSAGSAFAAADLSVRMAFTSAIEVSGNIWIAYLTDTSSATINATTETGAVAKSAVYSVGFPDPFGSPALTGVNEASVYAVAEYATEVGSGAILEIA